MTQDFFLTVQGVTDARTLNALISQISRYQTICLLCGDQAAFIPYAGRLILEKDTIAKKLLACIMAYTLV